MAVHNKNDDKVVQFFRQSGLSTDEIDVFLHLFEHGPQTVLALSRGLNTGRTKLYPVLEKLAEKQLVSVREKHYGTSYEAMPAESVEQLVHAAEMNGSILRHSFPSVLTSLRSLRTDSPSFVKITEFSGNDEYKQVFWDAMTSDNDMRVIEVPKIRKRLDAYFLKKTEKALPGRKQVMRLTNQKTGLSSDRKHVSPQLFEFDCEIYTYGNTVAIVRLDDAKLRCVVVQSELLSLSQKQFFDFLWRQSS